MPSKAELLLLPIVVVGIFFVFGTQQLAIAQEQSEGVTLPVEPGSMVHDVKDSAMIMPPKKQMMPNMDPHTVICKENLTLVLKATDFSPACVKPTSVEKLKERGWALKHDITHEEIMSMMK